MTGRSSFTGMTQNLTGRTKPMKFNKVLILVELESGDVHQVLAKSEMKALAIKLLAEDGVLKLSDQIEAVRIQPKVIT